MKVYVTETKCLRRKGRLAVTWKDRINEYMHE